MPDKTNIFSLYSGWLVSQCLWSLAGDIELFGNTLLHKMHRTSEVIHKPQRQIVIIVRNCKADFNEKYPENADLSLEAYVLHV